MVFIMGHRGSTGQSAEFARQSAKFLGYNRRPASFKKGKSAFMTRLTAICLAIGAALAPGFAQAAEGNPAAGKNKSAMCAGCHGIPGYKTAFPVTYSVPKLGGQHAAYIVKALQGYKSGDRTHPSMRAIAAGLTDQDMADVAAYYATTAVQSASK
jgi:cytochrome c553